ncbi:MAG TPA: tRNA epoxyqueuosine(34) reductase QueG, partial [Candidatus Eremiobacteraceae bacterium]|nr:tRNA epoxyqueuosine(34) reductase QueG [Candidatus Eremiobacteraceae bacterium]
MTDKARIVARAEEIGFDLVRVTHAGPFPDVARVLRARRDQGLLGQWRYPDERIERECAPRESLPEARSIVCTATSYLTRDRAHDPDEAGLRGALSRHAWGRDYHRVIGGRLRELAAFIAAAHPDVRCVPCVDTGPLIDRAAAVRAGIGWYGKNGNVLTKEFGSWVLLGSLITTLELEPDEALATNCGACEVCVERCPTGAIGPDAAIDARRCISDLTQLKTPIPRELRAAIGNRVWGCDDCQSPCPVNDRNAAPDASQGTKSFAPLPHLGTSVYLPA